MTHEKDLLADPKERAEHVMLVDLARNDIGEVCDYDVEVKDTQHHRTLQSCHAHRFPIGGPPFNGAHPL